MLFSFMESVRVVKMSEMVNRSPGFASVFMACSRSTLCLGCSSEKAYFFLAVFIALLYLEQAYFSYLSMSHLLKLIIFLYDNSSPMNS